MLRSTRTWLNHALFVPQTRMQWGVFLFIIALITVSVFEIAVVSQYPKFSARYASGIQLFRTVIASIFVVEITLRVLARPAPRDYLLT